MHIAIIGGGAAGLMAAAAASENFPEARISIIERNTSLGKKVMISGGGRCNVTTGVTDIRTVLERYPRGGKFLTSAIRRFPPEAVMEWFESHEVPLKTEKDLRVFPVSNNGRDIVGVFERIFNAHPANVQVLLQRHVAGVQKTDLGFTVSLKDGKTIEADAVILTTGGQAYRETGSTGDGYAFAESLGHAITQLAPSLNSFFTRELWPKELSGVSIYSATLSLQKNPKISYTGPFLFTHRGLSGPAVFALSSLVAFDAYDAAKPLEIFIDLFPDASEEALTVQFLDLCRKDGKKAIKTIFGFLLPNAMADFAAKQSKLDPEKQAAHTTKTEAAQAAHWMKHIPLRIIGRGAGEEFVTAGGVETTEVNPHTMESKICPGLFFAGEILNIDGFTGGFNLQASWATGRIAGENAGK